MGGTVTSPSVAATSATGPDAVGKAVAKSERTVTVLPDPIKQAIWRLAIYALFGNGTTGAKLRGGGGQSGSVGWIESGARRLITCSAQ
jgi:hypothetical protein